jgi:hypothetical protein
MPPPKNVSPAPIKPAPQKASTLKKVVYAIILLIALSLILQVLGINVLDRRESDTLIERPHENQ